MIDQTLDITETVIQPAPVVVPTDGVRYSAVYDYGGHRYTAEFEIGRWTQAVVVTQQDNSLYVGFASTRPPMDLFEPAFAAWLDTFMTEARRRYEARTAVEA